MDIPKLILVCAFLFGSSCQAAEPGDALQLSAPIGTGQVLLRTLPDGVQNLLQYALSHEGISYHKGGTNPESGFDCSGFVSYVFDQAVGVVLPHSARAISQVGKYIQLTELHPGDLVFFHFKYRTVSHVGIYLGNNQFIHDASNRTGGVRISNLTGYWAKHFEFARRFNAFLAMVV